VRDWPPYVIAGVAFLVLAPLAAFVGKRYGRSIKGGVVMGSILLGFGHVLDPPGKQAIEAAREDPGKKGPPAPGDPPTD
jgi:hypothetical protein